jgi:hypothetical protein
MPDYAPDPYKRVIDTEDRGPVENSTHLQAQVLLLQRVGAMDLD